MNPGTVLLQRLKDPQVDSLLTDFLSVCVARNLSPIKEATASLGLVLLLLSKLDLYSIKYKFGAEQLNTIKRVKFNMLEGLQEVALSSSVRETMKEMLEERNSAECQQNEQNPRSRDSC